MSTPFFRIKDCITLLLLITCASVHQPALAQDVFEKLLGTWDLLALEVKTDSGKWVAAPLGDGISMVGIISYAADHSMSVQISAEPRGEPLAMTNAEMVAGYIAYYGTFSIEENQGIINHVRTQHINPSLIGTNAPRAYEFIDDKLILSVVPERSIRLVWQAR